MRREEELFHEIGRNLKQADAGKLFGVSCLKVNNKAFACYYKASMVFRLRGDVYEYAMELKNACLFDPSGKKRPMKEWVQLSYIHHRLWANFAARAMENVQSDN
jgi:hypothetical protein